MTEFFTHISVVINMVALFVRAIMEGLFYTLAALVMGTLVLASTAAFIFQTFRRSK